MNTCQRHPGVVLIYDPAYLASQGNPGGASCVRPMKRAAVTMPRR